MTGVAIVVRGEDPTVALDRGQMHGAFVNVLLNAADAMGRRGEIEVEITTGDGQSGVTIADRGPGIDPDVIEKVFEPFFTTKTRGVGLGLATARRIAEAHGGALTARPRSGGGAMVAFTLPLAAPGAASAGDPAQPGHAPRAASSKFPAVAG